MQNRAVNAGSDADAADKLSQFLHLISDFTSYLRSSTAQSSRRPYPHMPIVADVCYPIHYAATNPKQIFET